MKTIAIKKEKKAHFEQVKQQNRRLIRNILRKESPLRIAELADRTHLSYPTVSALVKELVASGEVTINPEPESCGGRPGLRYEANPVYKMALIMYFQDWTLIGIVYDACGSVVTRTCIEAMDTIDVPDILSFIRQRKEQYPTISLISIGVPGAVNGDRITHLPKFKNLEGDILVKAIKEQLSVPCMIENDINAVARGEVGQFVDFAHLVYVSECMGVGIVLNGELVRGSNGYAGEMEYLVKNRNDYVESFVTCILALCCVLDLPDILLSKEDCDATILHQVQEELLKIYPRQRMPRLHFIDHFEGRYERGLLEMVLSKWEEEEL
ncbi:MAG: hypothetical protein PWP24_102 [Clostridiales bacterium]|nr:hypothetical protein [Clostridiales bacterium]